MEAFVLDASVAISWCFPNDPTENTPYSRSILRQIEEADAVVPEIWPSTTLPISTWLSGKSSLWPRQIKPCGTLCLHELVDWSVTKFGARPSETSSSR